MTALQRKPTHNLIEQKRSVLEHTYPAWNVHRRGDMWSAARAAAPTPTQVEAGLHRYIVQPSMEALAAILAQQLEIAHRIRG